METTVEKLLFYIILIKSRFISKEIYTEYLDKVFMENSDNELLFELEICFGDIYLSEKKIDKYIQDGNKFDYEVLSEFIFNYLKDTYKNIKKDNNLLEDFIYNCCTLYKFLPKELQQKDSFNKFFYLDDILYDEDYLYYFYDGMTVIELLNKLFDL